MIKRLAARILPLSLSLGLAILGLATDSSVGSTATEQPAPAGSADLAITNDFQPVRPGPVDGQIAAVTAYMLTNYHYLKKPFDASVASQFLDMYLDTLDPQHIHFLQSDIAEFAQYRTNLDRMTDTGLHHAADTTPACKIFNRFVERLEQRSAYAQDLLKHEKFTFNTDERITINRKGMPYPANLDEAKKLWRERLRFEYLQELLGKIGAREQKRASAAKQKAAGTNAVARAAESPKEAVAPTSPEAPRTAVLPSPKDADRAAALQATAETAHQPEQQKPSAEAAAQATTATTQAAAPSPKKTDDEEIVDTLLRRYHRNLRFFTDWNNDDVLQIYLTALAHVYDPHSDYLGHAQLQQFAIGMNLSLFGIGAELVSDDGYCKIRRLLPGGPAIKGKLLKENDRIIAVAQSNQPPVDVVDMSLNKVVQLIRGPKGTQVRLTVIPAGEDASNTKVVSIMRDEIPLEESAAKAKIIDMPDTHGGTVRLGLIDLPSFYATFDTSSSKDRPEPRSTTADVAKLLTKLKEENVGGVILDLRRNGGGSLEEAIHLTGLFIKTGPVVQVRDESGKVQEADDTDPGVLYSGPLIVLTSRYSASASEILAGALQDYGRALIVGDSSTHGKGTVQSVNALRPFLRVPARLLTEDPGALKLTIKEFFRPSGMSTQLKGVIPDIILPSIASVSKDVGESSLDNPLPCERIASAEYDHFNLVEPYLPELRRRSGERVATNQEFGFVREDIALFKKHQDDKTISLNEKQRLKEQEEAEARQKEREKERLAHPGPRETVYDISLEQAGKPGLPVPEGKTNELAKVTSSAAVATNSAAAAADLPGDPDEVSDTPPPLDAPLIETEHILADYLSMLPKGSLVKADEPAARRD